jgi:hypothetical protein
MMMKITLCVLWQHAQSLIRHPCMELHPPRMLLKGAELGCVNIRLSHTKTTLAERGEDDHQNRPMKSMTMNTRVAMLRKPPILFRQHSMQDTQHKFDTCTAQG